MYWVHNNSPYITYLPFSVAVRFNPAGALVVLVAAMFSLYERPRFGCSSQVVSLIAVGTHTIVGLKALVSSLTSQSVQSGIFRKSHSPSNNTAIPSINTVILCYPPRINTVNILQDLIYSGKQTGSVAFLLNKSFP